MTHLLEDKKIHSFHISVTPPPPSGILLLLVKDFEGDETLSHEIIAKWIKISYPVLFLKKKKVRTLLLPSLITIPFVTLFADILFQGFN